MKLLFARALVVAVIVGVAAVVIGLPGTPLVAWELLVLGGLSAVLWRLPSRPRPSPNLIGRETGVRVAPTRVLAPLELEVAGSCDPRLGGDRRVRRRLLRLFHHRVALRGDREADGRRLLGDGAWEVLTLENGPTTHDDLEVVVERIERL